MDRHESGQKTVKRVDKARDKSKERKDKEDLKTQKQKLKEFVTSNQRQTRSQGKVKGPLKELKDSTKHTSAKITKTLEK